MPRDRRGQAPQAENGQTYGVRNDQLEAQRQLPMLAKSDPLAGAPSAPVQPPPPADPMAELLAQAQAFQPPDPLVGPSQRPQEPVTAGMNVGPGAGREALVGRFARPKDFTADVLSRAAIASDSPELLRLADQVRRLRGGNPR